MSSSYDYMFKLHLAGDSGVGKSCLLLRFAEDTYTESYISTIGVDFKTKSISIGRDNKTAKLQIWDCAGQERFRTISSAYYRGAHGVIFLFDLTDQVSFNNIKNIHLEAAKRNASPDSEIILVGTKSDLDKKRVISYKEAKEYADSLGCQYIETSAKNNENVEELFFQFAEKIAQKITNNAFVPSNSQKSSSTSNENAAVKPSFTTEAFLLELKTTIGVMHTAIATNAFFKPTKPVYDALRTFLETYHITGKSSPEEIITAMGKLTEAYPEICHEGDAKKLLQMTGQLTASRCILQ